jgi:hypothetical protein
MGKIYRIARLHPCLVQGPCQLEAIRDLELEHLAIVYPGTKAFPLGDRASALPLRTLSERIPEFWPGPAA